MDLACWLRTLLVDLCHPSPVCTEGEPQTSRQAFIEVLFFDSVKTSRISSEDTFERISYPNSDSLLGSSKLGSAWFWLSMVKYNWFNNCEDFQQPWSLQVWITPSPHMSFINGSSVKSPIETGSLASTVIRKSTGLFKSVNMFLLSLLSVGLTQELSSPLRSRKKIWSQCSEIQATNSTLDMHDLFPIYSRFSFREFCISHLTEYTSITIHGTVFYQITTHRAQNNRITALTKIPVVPPRTLHLTIYLKHDSNDITL